MAVIVAHSGVEFNFVGDEQEVGQTKRALASVALGRLLRQKITAADYLELEACLSMTPARCRIEDTILGTVIENMDEDLASRRKTVVHQAAMGRLAASAMQEELATLRTLDNLPLLSADGTLVELRHGLVYPQGRDPALAEDTPDFIRQKAKEIGANWVTTQYDLRQSEDGHFSLDSHEMHHYSLGTLEGRNYTPLASVQ